MEDSTRYVTAAKQFLRYYSGLLSEYPDSEYLRVGKEFVEEWINLLEQHDVDVKNARKLLKLIKSSEYNGSMWDEMESWFQGWYSKFIIE